LTVLLVGFWAVAWGGATLLSPVLLRSAVDQLNERLKQFNIGIADVSFTSVTISPFLNSIEIRDLSTDFDLNLRDRIQLQSTINTQLFKVRLDRPLRLIGSVQAIKFEVHLDASDLPRSLPFDRFINAQLIVGNLPLTQPRQVMQEIRRKLKELFIENKAVGDVQFSGDVKLIIDDVEAEAHLYTEQDDDRFRLRFRGDDIQQLSDLKGMELSPEQISIVSYYPLRVPVILIATDRALDSAKRYESNDVWLRDAHRHVVWSFLLTQHFGPDFATKVTDAQETRQGNTPNERAMDFHNNAIGRRFFAEGVKLSELTKLIREDPDIIRYPDEVDSFGEKRLLR
jgi:hypothetical protein